MLPDNELLVIMKMNPKKLVVLGILAVFPTVQGSENPSGEISANAKLVRAGLYPKLDWSITYPTAPLDGLNLDGENGGESGGGLEGVAEIDPNGTIVPQKDLKMQVRVLAADFELTRQVYKWFRNWRGQYYQGLVSEKYQVPVKAWGCVRGGYWEEITDKTQDFIDPSAIVWEKDLAEDDEVIFSSQVDSSGLPRYRSGVSSPNVIVLKNGDVPPAYVGWQGQSSLGTHISAYLNPDGTIKLGPLDMIVAFELYYDMAGSQSSSGDMQDMLLHVTFQTR